TYEALVTKTETITTTVPTCADGTKYGECSATKPFYCYSGSLINKCATCGCPSGKTCDNNACWAAPPQNATCNSAADCGTTGFTGSYFCQNSDVYRNYVNFGCTYPGSSNSYCSSNTTATLIDDCGTNEYCVSGQSSCQMNTTTPTANATCGTDVCQANEVCNDPLQGCMLGCQTTANCPASGYTGDYFCYLGDVWRRNITYECVTAHGAPYYCDSAITPYVTDDCTGTEYCIEGQSTCQLNQSVQLPSGQLTPLSASSNSCYANCCRDTCSYGASKAIDNSLSTRWASNRVTPPSTSAPHWLSVDLGQSRAVSTIELTLHGYLAQNYQLQSSADNVNWALVDSRSNAVGTITHTPSATARYWRISVTYSADNGQANLYEFKLFS
ncbi:discoidin domain-containing protein, partial [Candidatus Woesearchaeota archaeon]|nr:discoidin domain-containing protein [Candidatus Woesearchaeota archaeon]